MQVVCSLFHTERAKKEGASCDAPSKRGYDSFLLEVTLQQALQSNTVAGLVASHFVDGVVDSVQTVLLSADSQIELALSCAELAVRKSVRSGHFLRQFLLCAFG